MFWKARKGSDNYPLDLDASLRTTWPTLGVAPRLTIPIAGALRTLVPLADAFYLATNHARQPWGPSIGPVDPMFAVPVNSRVGPKQA